MPALNIHLNLRNNPTPPTPISTPELLQTIFEGLAAVIAFLALAFALWKFRGKFRTHYRRRRQQRSFELEAQLPEPFYTRGSFRSGHDSRKDVAAQAWVANVD